LIGDGHDVRNEFIQSVGCHAEGLTAEVVATLVGNDHTKSGGGQRLDLPVPRIPEFREAVEKHDGGAVFRASGNRVQVYCAILE